jgi:peroxiredoxin Q/BCP
MVLPKIFILGTKHSYKKHSCIQPFASGFDLSLSRALSAEASQMHSTHVLIAATLAAAPAAAFQPGPLAMSLRGAAVSRSQALAAAPRMTASEGSDEYSISRRDFFKDVAMGSAALTIGSMGIEVPQAMADGLPAVSAPAPAFTLPSNAGKDISVSDLKGKWAVLYFYPGDFTSGCTIEAQNFEKNADSIRKLGAEIYGVSVDGVDKHLDFSKKYGLSFPLLSDKDGKVSEKYGSALKIPFMGTFSNRQTYILDPEGNLRWVFTDVQSRLAKHAEEVMDKLKELQA